MRRGMATGVSLSLDGIEVCSNHMQEHSRLLHTSNLTEEICQCDAWALLMESQTFSRWVLTQIYQAKQATSELITMEGCANEYPYILAKQGLAVRQL